MDAFSKNFSIKAVSVIGNSGGNGTTKLGFDKLIYIVLFASSEFVGGSGFVMVDLSYTVKAIYDTRKGLSAI